MLRIHLRASRNAKASGALGRPQTPGLLSWVLVFRYFHQRPLTSLVFYKKLSSAKKGLRLKVGILNVGNSKPFTFWFIS